MNSRKPLAGVVKRWIMVCICSGLTACAAEEPVEYLYLDHVAEPKRWSPAECEVSVSPLQAWEQPVLMMRIPVDYNAGEKLYPIGWPRMYLSLKSPEQVWSEYDRLEFQIRTEFSRSKLPKRPLIFHLYDQQGKSHFATLDMAAINEWRTVTLNLYDLGLPDAVVRLGFNINEADYQDQDLVVFHLGGFRLVRATAACLTEFSAVAPVIFCDSRVLPLEMVVEGPPAKLAGGIPVQLTGKDKNVLQHSIPVIRGRQIVNIPLGEVPLMPGPYSVSVFPDDPALKKTVEILVASSPW
ncbi:MAG: hypothetical protein PHO37_14520 [Kiritimatiellae bacterium]|nr:hypothetical protein [Kiritimatiellia bacterium]